MANFQILPPAHYPPPAPPEVLVLPLFKNKISWDLIEKFTGHQVSVDFKGEWKETCLLYPQEGGRKVYLLGLGDPDQSKRAEMAFRSLAFKHRKDWTEVGVYLDEMPPEIHTKAAQGLTLGFYSTKDLKKQLADQRFDLAYSFVSGHEEATKWLDAGLKTAHSQAAMMRLVDLPANIKTPQFIADYAKVSSLRNRYKFTRYEMGDLAKHGLHAVLAVGQGSIHPPLMLELEYNGSGNEGSRPQLGLVGKGVTFDTGGISIKGATNMHYMKSDMGGAAAVLGAVEMAAKFELPIHLVAAIPLAENSVDAHSIKPGDVINSYSGKTIEVINTDAEGRLIMADALAWLHKKFNPEVLMDLATLTGDCVRTLGYEAAGLFSNNAELIEGLQKAGNAVHERLWAFPMWEEYGKDLHSDVADIKNIGSRPIFGAIFAGKFLESFIGDHPKWAHIDMAGVAFGDSEFAKTKSATGYGVQLLFEFMKQLSNKS